MNAPERTLWGSFMSGLCGTEHPRRSRSARTALGRAGNELGGSRTIDESARAHLNACGTAAPGSRPRTESLRWPDSESADTRLAGGAGRLSVFADVSASCAFVPHATIATTDAMRDRKSTRLKSSHASESRN